MNISVVFTYVQIFTRNVYKVGGEVCTIAQPSLDQSIGVVSQGLSACTSEYPQVKEAQSAVPATSFLRLEEKNFPELKSQTLSSRGE
jgi:hypothetical protein